MFILNHCKEQPYLYSHDEPQRKLLKPFVAVSSCGKCILFQHNEAKLDRNAAFYRWLASVLCLTSPNCILQKRTAHTERGQQIRT